VTSFYGLNALMISVTQSTVSQNTVNQRKETHLMWKNHFPLIL